MAVAEDLEEDANDVVGRTAQEAAIAVLSACRQLFDKETTPKTKRVLVKYDRERARSAVLQDYWGPYPIFSD
jgi:hypothetical protein